MKIQTTAVELQRSNLTKGVEKAVSGPKKEASPTASPAADRADSVQISDAGRALASQQAEVAGGAHSALTPERIGEIRERILQGAYDSVEVVEEVARRMLERGDI